MIMNDRQLMQDLMEMKLLAVHAAGLSVEEIPIKHLFRNSFGVGDVKSGDEEYRVLYNGLVDGSTISYGVCMGCGNHTYCRINDCGNDKGRALFMYNSQNGVFVPGIISRDDVKRFGEFASSLTNMFESYL
ncbi:MAG: hypothetical protein HZB67_05400 [Candidatus Aenigmarchaeota archaeon]|nr:hypothetical protein [Candidatus Aenigmarchaeota archaeon]